MKRLMIAVIGLSVLTGSYFALAQAPGQGQQKAAPKAAAPAAGGLTDLNSKASYGFGLNVGSRLKEQSTQFELDPKIVARGIVDGLTDAQPLLGEEEIQQVMQEFEQQLLARQLEAEEKMAAQVKAEAGTNKQAIDAFQADQAVKATASGLRYKVVTPGTGATPQADDIVQVHYKGMLLDGTEFDSSYRRGQPATFPVNGVIPGWTEALQMMKVGGKWQIHLPSALAYGEAGTPDGTIPPNSDLFFEVELLDVQQQQPAPGGAQPAPGGAQPPQ